MNTDSSLEEATVLSTEWDEDEDPERTSTSSDPATQLAEANCTWLLMGMAALAGATAGFLLARR